MRHPNSTLGLAALLLCLVVSGGSSLQAQQVLPAPVFTGDSALAGLSWSSDSQSVSFAAVSGAATYFQPDFGLWWQYDVYTGKLMSSSTWSLQGTISPTYKTLAMVTPPDGMPTFVFASPDKRFNIFTDFRHNVQLNDTQSDQVAAVPTEIVSPGMGITEYNVYWNSTGTAFAITNGASILGVGTNFAENIEHLTFNRDVGHFTLSETLYYGTWPPRVYGISDDGEWVLLPVTKEDISIKSSNDLEQKLALFNTTDSSRSRIIDGLDGKKVIGAGFVPHSIEQVIIVDDTGLKEYNIVTGDSRVLNAQFSPILVKDVVFSPDGQWVAAIGTRTDRAELYVVSTIQAPIPPTAATIPPLLP